jgi:hypothetical protein
MLFVACAFSFSLFLVCFLCVRSGAKRSVAERS